MKSSQYKIEAKKSLKGKWLKSACITLIYFLIFFFLKYIQRFLPTQFNIILNVLYIVISIPCSFGYIASLFNIYNDKENNIFSLFKIGFNNFGKAWNIFFHMLIKMIVPVIMIFISLIIAAISLSLFAISLVTKISIFLTLILLFIILISFGFYIAGLIILIIKSYLYPLSYVIAVESPDLTTKEILNKSESLMENRRANLFILQFSFIGWAILALFTFGLGYLWLIPYIIFSTFAFYNNVKAEKSYKIQNRD